MKSLRTTDDFSALRAGDTLSLSGVLHTSRDAALKRSVNGLPFEAGGAFIYFAGPTAAPSGHVIGSIGPTTSARMEIYIERLLQAGIKGFIGKGAIKLPDVFKRYGGVYLCAVGGAGALYSGCVRSAEVAAFPELGCEAIRRLEVAEMPLICGIDSLGNTLF